MFSKTLSILAALAIVITIQLTINFSNKNQVEATITYIEAKYPLKVSKTDKSLERGITFQSIKFAQLICKIIIIILTYTKLTAGTTSWSRIRLAVATILGKNSARLTYQYWSI